MEVITEYPLTNKALSELKILAAASHAELAGSYINSLPCSVEQKCDILLRLCQEADGLIHKEA